VTSRNAKELVYLIQAGDRGPVKIGSTRDANSLRSRLATLQTGSPERLFIRAVGSGGSTREGELHKRFRHLRLYGEWFRVDEELLTWAAYGISPEEQDRTVDEHTDVIEMFREHLELAAPEDASRQIVPLVVDVDAVAHFESEATP
jgi:T5orf172 domain